MATRIAVMSGGHIIQTGTPREIYYHPADRFVADFIGESNFLSGVTRVDGGGTWFDLTGGGRVTLPERITPGPGTLMIRPEAIEVGPVEAGRAGSLKGRVSQVAFLGNHTRITIDTAAGALVVHRPYRSGAAEEQFEARLGEEACLWWPVEIATILTSGTTEANDGSPDQEATQ